MVRSLKSIVLTLVGLMFFVIGQPVLAQEIESESNVTPQAFNYLKEANCYFVDSGNGVISVSGKTTTYSTVDNITTTVYVQRQTLTGWVNVKNWTNSESNTSYCNVSGTITVTKGYNYRAYCYHQVDEGNLTETTKSYTSSYLVE